MGGAAKLSSHIFRLYVSEMGKSVGCPPPSSRAHLTACTTQKSSSSTETDEWVVGTQFVNEGKLVTNEDYNKKRVGALCARDYKGPGNSHSIDDGKLILQ